MKKSFAKKFLVFTLGVIIISSLIGSLVFIFPPKLQKTNPIQKAIDFINNTQLDQKAELLGWSEESGVYKILFKIGQTQYQSFVTKDGKFFFPFGYDLDQKLPEKTTQVQKTPEKRERPEVKVFVMSYCPFGLQMEKAILPVFELLKEKIDFGIYFVDYIMHGKKEMDENLRQYCIQKEEKEKYLGYLSCFLEKGSDDNPEIYKDCFKQVNIDEKKVQECMSQTDKEFKITELYNDKSSWIQGTFPQFNIHKDLNEKYGVQGSPTLVINEAVIEVERSPERIKEAICNSFLNPPKECEIKLSQEQASPGFGLGQGGSSGQCK